MSSIKMIKMQNTIKTKCIRERGDSAVSKAPTLSTRSEDLGFVMRLRAAAPLLLLSSAGSRVNSAVTN